MQVALVNDGPVTRSSNGDRAQAGRPIRTSLTAVVWRGPGVVERISTTTLPDFTSGIRMLCMSRLVVDPSRVCSTTIPPSKVQRTLVTRSFSA